MVDFDPFNKPLRDLGLSDLDLLADNNISEGVYIEYKRSLPSNQSIAKVIASFANTHGGYFVIGVAEEEITNIASGQIGINIDEHPNPKETIRHIVRDHLDPSPNYTTRLLRRQDYENYALAILEVPESQDAPHVHSSGKIYTRTGEGSDPISAETDRWTIDKMYERREEWNRQIQNFCQLGLTFTQGQAGTTEHQADGTPFLEIYGIPSSLGRSVCSDLIKNIDDFRSILEESPLFLPEIDSVDTDDVEFSLGREYDSYRASSGAVVAQQFFESNQGRDPASTPGTVKFFEDGGLKVLLSVPLIDSPRRYAGPWERFQQETDGNMDYIRFVDADEMLLKVYTLLNSYLHLLKECGWKNESARTLQFKARTRNGYRTALMFNELWYSEYIDEYGVPILYENRVEIPREGTRPLYSVEGEEYDGIIKCLLRVVEAFGLPRTDAHRTPEHLWELLYDMMD